MIGYILLLATSNPRTEYGATFLICLVNALQLMIANLAGFVATFIYQEKWAPRHVEGHAVVLE